MSLLDVARAALLQESETIRDRQGREWGPRRGLEGPFRYRGGQVLYYDTRERGGRYLDPVTDRYLDHDEAQAIIG